MCQTQAHGPNLLRSLFMIGPPDGIKCAVELASGLCYIFCFKFNFSCVCNIKIWLLQILCLSEIKVLFPYERLNIAYQLQLIFQ